jgi:hypothetical protein
MDLFWYYNPHSPSPMLPVFDSHIIQVYKQGRGGETMEMFNTREYERIDLSKIACSINSDVGSA